jgi:NDP-sugar pyrophosphorylase family protein
MLTSDRAVILAAGLGTRLSIISGFLSKPLVRFEGMPLLEHVMSRARQATSKGARADCPSHLTNS